MNYLSFHWWDQRSTFCWLCGLRRMNKAGIYGLFQCKTGRFVFASSLSEKYWFWYDWVFWCIRRIIKFFSLIGRVECRTFPRNKCEKITLEGYVLKEAAGISSTQTRTSESWDLQTILQNNGKIISSSNLQQTNLFLLQGPLFPKISFPECLEKSWKLSFLFSHSEVLMKIWGRGKNNSKNKANLKKSLITSVEIRRILFLVGFCFSNGTFMSRKFALENLLFLHSSPFRQGKQAESPLQVSDFKPSLINLLKEIMIVHLGSYSFSRAMQWNYETNEDNNGLRRIPLVAPSSLGCRAS